MDFSSWNELRNNQQLCDGIVRTSDGKEIHIHRVILVALSPFFRAFFTNSLNRGEPEPTEITIPDVPSIIIEQIIDFAYTQTCSLSWDNVFALTEAADQLSCTPIVTYCCDFIAKHLSPSNCIYILKFAKDYFLQDLELKAWHCAFLNAEETIRSSEFPTLTADELEHLLSVDELNIHREENVFEAISRWITVDPEARKQHYAKLLPCVRFGLVLPDFYHHIIKKFQFRTDESDALLSTIDVLFNVEEDAFYYRQCYFRPRVPNEVIFAFSGWCEGFPTDHIETYDKQSDCWFVVNIRDQSIRAYHGVVVLDNLIYVIGGFDGTEYFNTMHCFNPVTYTWTEKACMHDIRCYVSVCTFSGEIYALGGYNGRTRLNSAERYNPSLNQWTVIASMSVSRSDASAAVFEDKIYIAGGFNGAEVMCTVERYSPETNQWEHIRPMNSARSGLDLVAFHRHIYVLGGFDGTSRLSSVERYNPRQDYWEGVTDMQCRRSNMTSVVMNDQIYVIGGFDGTSTIPFTEIYDEDQDAWYSSTSMNLNRSALAACVCRGLPNAKSYTHLGFAIDPSSNDSGFTKIDI